jgi:hypothetical protein
MHEYRLLFIHPGLHRLRLIINVWLLGSAY